MPSPTRTPFTATMRLVRVMIGVNGMELDIIRPLILKGDMPNLASIIEKGAVANQFGVKSAIVGMVDFFGHQAVELRADFSGGMSRVHRDGGIGGEGGEGTTLHGRKPSC